MTKSISKKLYVLVAVLLVCIIVFGNLKISDTAYASTTKETFETTNVIDDLQSSVINGKSFNLSDYPLKEDGKPELISFLEYCYSYKSTLQKNYGLYIYVYNPQGLAFNTSTDRNKIQLRYGKVGNYNKYTLQFLNYSNKAGYEGLFYKFKVVLSAEQRKSILKTVTQDSRVYEISGFELCVDSEVKEYAIAQTLTYSGYALGYGPANAKESTLSCTSDGLKDVLHLEVTPTFYRPDGTNGKNNYTQDSLHSVYFAVPNDMITRFGEMTAVHATWLNAVIKPALVTGNGTAYSELSGYLGKDIGEKNEDLKYMYAGAYSYAYTTSTNVTWHNIGYCYNCYSPTIFDMYSRAEYGEDITALYMMFDSGNATDSADTFTVSSTILEQRMLDSKNMFGGELVNDKYSKAIFSSVDSEFTEVNIERDSEYSLTDETITQNWWQKIWGTSTVASSQTFDGIKAIYAIDKANDFNGTTAEISDRLFVDESDCEQLKNYCNLPENTNKTVYLFRYQVSDYMSQEATFFGYDSFMGLGSWKKIDTNAYFFYETVNLDFDIIDVTFTKDGVKTIIPVVMTPIDVIPDASPPVYTQTDDDPWAWLKKLLAIIAIVVLIVICMPIIPYIIKFLVWIIMLPIKLFMAIFKGLKSLFKKKE